MKSIFDKTTRDELISRINLLNDNSTAQWGQMSLYQMLRHCTLYEELLLGRKQFKRIFLGRIFGKFALKDLIGDDKPVKRNMPTIPEIKVTAATGDVRAEIANWIALLEEHANPSDAIVVHPFCGRLTKEDIGYLSYKHTDHHLRQFNV